MSPSLSSMPWLVGPCSIESRQYFLKAADFLLPVFADRNFFLKGSFDKANRTAVHGDRGPGLEESIDIFHELKEKHPGAKIITDVHEAAQVEKLHGVVDAIQVPAFLCRQTDLLQECGRLFHYVNVKKGQWLDPQQTRFFADKVRSLNADAQVWITERGTFFGYGNLVVDFRAAREMSQYCDHVILDCTHSTQFAQGETTSGDSELAEQYLLASVNFAYSGIFLETHFDPPNALSDKDSMIPTARIPALLQQYDSMQRLAQAGD